MYDDDRGHRGEYLRILCHILISYYIQYFSLKKIFLLLYLTQMRNTLQFELFLDELSVDSVLSLFLFRILT